jgi:hypothetical protein
MIISEKFEKFKIETYLSKLYQIETLHNIESLINQLPIILNCHKLYYKLNK